MVMDREERNRIRTLDGDQLIDLQLQKLNFLLEKILPENEFYSEKLSETQTQLSSLDELQNLPYTFKDELVSSGSKNDFAANLTYPVSDYIRFHRTSGTSGRPMVVLDTADDWQWWIETWQYVLDGAEIEAGDTVLLAFSFGPFIGFWSAFDALIHRKALVVPGGRADNVGSNRSDAIDRCNNGFLYSQLRYPYG